MGTFNAHNERMSTIRTVLTLAAIAGASACYQESAYAQGTTFPQQDPQVMQGPPGGQMDQQPSTRSRSRTRTRTKIPMQVTQIRTMPTRRRRRRTSRIRTLRRLLKMIRITAPSR